MPNFHVGIKVLKCGKACATLLTDVPLWAKKLFNVCLEGIINMLIAEVANVLCLTGMWPALVGLQKIQPIESLGTGRLAEEDSALSSMEGVSVTTQCALLQHFATVGTCHLHVKHR